MKGATDSPLVVIADWISLGHSSGAEIHTVSHPYFFRISFICCLSLMIFLMSLVVSSISVLLFSGPPVLVISLYVYGVSCDPLLQLVAGLKSILFVSQEYFATILCCNTRCDSDVTVVSTTRCLL